MSGRNRSRRRHEEASGHSSSNSTARWEQEQKSVHDNLYRDVTTAVEKVHHLEQTWTESDMVKRIVKHIYKSASEPDLLKLTGEEAIKKLVVCAMERYSAACQEKAWFFEINLVEVFLNVAWTLRLAPRQRYEYVEELVRTEYEVFLDRCLLVKGITHATHSSFNDDIVRQKVYNSLYRTYDNALSEVVLDMRPISDSERMKAFTKRWINESMQRAWSAVDGSLDSADRKLTEGTVTRLFSNLVRPFGADHPFSCLPEMWFVDQGGAPARSWPYIRQTVSNMFASWEKESASSKKPAKKRKKKATEDEEKISLDEDEEVEMGIPQDHELFQARQADVVDDELFEGEPGGDQDPENPNCRSEEDVVDDELFEGEPGGDQNPNCTSEEDCVGSASDRLVQHLLKEGRLGDRYCVPCWCSFLQQNSQLEGVYEDNGATFDTSAAHHCVSKDDL